MTLTRQHFKSLALNIGKAISEINKMDIKDTDKAVIKDVLVSQINIFCGEWNAGFDKEKFEKAINENTETYEVIFKK